MMKQPWILLLALAFAGAAQAQYRWVDKDGKTRYGDTPPPGVKATKMGAPASGRGPAPVPAAASKDAKKGPMTPAEKEQDYRNRQEEAKKEQEKAEKERKHEQDKSEDCARNREYVMTLESGQRIMRTRPDGERYYLEDAQREQELAEAKRLMKDCK
jgi:hypothetical protein